MSSSSPPRSRARATGLLAAAAVLATAALAGAVLGGAKTAGAASRLEVVSVVAGQDRVSVIVGVRPPPPTPVRPGTFRVDDGAGTDLGARAEPVIGSELAAGVVMDTSAAGAEALQGGINGAASFLLQLPAGASSLVIADGGSGPAALTPLAEGPTAAVMALNAARSGGERHPGAALAAALAGLPTASGQPRLLLLYTGAADAGGTPAAELSRTLRAAGVLLAVVATGDDQRYWSRVTADTGGVLVSARGADTLTAFDQVAQLLRELFALTFPRPAGLPATVRVSVRVGAETATRAVVVPADPGEAVRQEPEAGSSPLWWVLGPLLALAAAGAGVLLVRRRARSPGSDDLAGSSPDDLAASRAGQVATPHAGPARPRAGTAYRADPGTASLGDPGAASRADPGAASRADPGTASRADPGTASRADPGTASRGDPGGAGPAAPERGWQPDAPIVPAGPLPRRIPGRPVPPPDPPATDRRAAERAGGPAVGPVDAAAPLPAPPPMPLPRSRSGASGSLRGHPSTPTTARDDGHGGPASPPGNAVAGPAADPAAPDAGSAAARRASPAPSGSAPAPDPDPGPDANTNTDPVPDPDANKDPDASTDANPDVGAKPDPDANTDPDANPDVGAKPDPDANTNPNTEADERAYARLDAETGRVAELLAARRIDFRHAVARIAMAAPGRVDLLDRLIDVERLLAGARLDTSPAPPTTELTLLAAARKVVAGEVALVGPTGVRVEQGHAMLRLTRPGRPTRVCRSATELARHVDLSTLSVDA